MRSSTNAYNSEDFLGRLENPEITGNTSAILFLVTDLNTFASPCPQSAQDHIYFSVSQLGPIVPLDTQFGLAEKEDAPEILADLTFPAAPDLYCYAILDAAVVPLLPELLETSGLPHRCLFTEDALDKHGAHGPWLVQLKPNTMFSRNLFTQATGSATGWHLWGMDAGIFVQSEQGFEAVWGHLRKLVLVRDAHDNWFYFRFWEPQMAGAFWPLFEGDAAEAYRRFGAGVLSAVFWQEGDMVHLVQINTPATRVAPSRDIVSIYAPYFKQARWVRFCTRVASALRAELPQYNPDTAQVDAWCGAAKIAGYHREKAIYDYVLACALFSQRGISYEAIHRDHVRPGAFPDDLSAARSFLAGARALPDMKGESHE